MSLANDIKRKDKQDRTSIHEVNLGDGAMLEVHLLLGDLYVVLSISLLNGTLDLVALVTGLFTVASSTGTKECSSLCFISLPLSSSLADSSLVVL